MSRPEVAEYIGVQRGTLNRYKLPPADAQIGRVQGWLKETIDEWQQRRPGRGNHPDQANWNLPPELR
ncbi:helix-turn-helix transcriptional regulator [Nocardia panacis]|nr:XRE family transcriptional regulator [Nocardia panacis]